MALRRIMREYSVLQKDPPSHASAGPVSTKDMFYWRGTVMGPVGSYYEGGIFFFDIWFPRDYPFKPPKLLFKTKIYHPGITAKGEHCLGILQPDCWSPALHIWKVLRYIYEFLKDINADDPLVPSIAKVYKTDRKKFARIAKEWVVKYTGCPYEPPGLSEEQIEEMEMDEKERKIFLLEEIQMIPDEEKEGGDRILRILGMREGDFNIFKSFL